LADMWSPIRFGSCAVQQNVFALQPHETACPWLSCDQALGTSHRRQTAIGDFA
jgi:hypothetical protein